MSYQVVFWRGRFRISHHTAGREGFEPSKAPYGILTGLANPRTRPTMRPPREVTKPRASLPATAISGERRPAPSPSDRDDVRDRGERDLLRRLRTEVQSDRCMDARERTIGDPRRAELVKQTAGVTSAPHHPEIRRLGQQKDAQRGLRELAIVPRDDAVALGPQAQLDQLFGVAHDDTLVRFRRVGWTDRDGPDHKAEDLPHRGERADDGARADHDQLGSRGRPRDRF